MTTLPTPPDDLTRDLEALLVSDAGPEEFARRLFALDYARTYAADPTLAWAMRACAIPRSFDAAIIGVLRDAPDEQEENERLLAGLLPFSFVLAHKDGGYVYHDNIRDLLLAEWESEENREEFEEIKGRLAGFYRRRGERYLEKEEYESALADFKIAVELQAEDGASYLGLGKSQYYLKDYQAALVSFNSVITGPEGSDNYFWRGRAQYGLKDYVAALSDFNHAIEVQPEDGNFYYWRGRTRYALQDYTMALADLTRAVELHPQGGDNYYWRGMTYYQRQDYPAALADLSRAVDLQPEDGYNYYWRGRTHYQMRNYGVALVDLSRAVELQPNNGYRYHWRGRAYYQMQDYTAALADLSWAIELQPKSTYNYYWRALSYCQMQKYKTALNDMTRAAELRVDNSHDFFWRSTVHGLLNHEDEAQADLERATLLAGKERKACERCRVQAKLALLVGQINSAREYYLLALNGTCRYPELRTELDHLQLLSRMFPARDDIRAMAEWFAAQLAERA